MGTKNTQEAMIAFINLAAMLAEHFKDGVQISDVGPVISKLSNDPLKQELINAYNEIDQVPSEVKDMSLTEVMQLLIVIMPALENLKKAVSK